jgi:hypothetical protein
VKSANHLSLQKFFSLDKVYKATGRLLCYALPGSLHFDPARLTLLFGRCAERVLILIVPFVQ